MDEAWVILDCADCAEETEWEILKDTPNGMTVRCGECHGIRNIQPRRAKITTLPLIVSVEEQSLRDYIDVPTLEEIKVGDEFEHNGHRMLVTAIQDQEHNRVEKAEAAQVQLIHAKLYDTVRLKCSINVKDVTKSEELIVSPEFEVHMGMVIELPSGAKGVVKSLKSDQNRTLHKGFLMARNIVRVFMDPAPTRARHGNRYSYRQRGLPMGKKSEKPTSRVKGPRGQRSNSRKR